MKVFRSIVLRLTPLYDEREARAMARSLFEECFSLSMAHLAMDADERLTDQQQACLHSMVSRLEKGEPLQYVIGRTTFCGCVISVNPHVLIPRPETEQLVSIVSNNAKNRQHPAPRLLDIGTGSGCIAVALARALPQASVAAWDISPEALGVARDNARNNGVEVDFRLQDALCPPDDCSCWDAIVSNPPYVCMSEQSGMHTNVLGHEPPLALFVPDDDALRFYRAIACYACHALCPGGLLAFEINPHYAQQLQALLAAKGFLSVSITDDMFARQRFVTCQKPLR